MKNCKVKISGTGMYMPKKVMTNHDLEKFLDTNDEWIRERTGIAQRRIADTNNGELPSDMAKLATEEALKNANMDANEIDMILFATIKPDQILPNTACILQQKLGIKSCAALDISAACTGFVYAFNMASSMIETKMFKNILVVGSEVNSQLVDWKDRKSCILFGDGCGVAILSYCDDSSSEVIASALDADGKGADFFRLTHGGAQFPINQEAIDKRDIYMKMQGQEMFKVAVRTLADNAKLVLEDSPYSVDDVDWVVPHQANSRIIEATIKRLGINPQKVIINIEKYGNTSAATVPVALHEAIEDGRIKRGDLILFDAFGAGLTSGATLLRY